ncbi:hypothetical protein, partial [Chitinophaga sp. CB10]|uniref:hypothetical protein n=1 Tax=Chitinophaga sp. CB10 TaxID=1891659 RepID=UPI0025C04379
SVKFFLFMVKIKVNESIHNSNSYGRSSGKSTFFPPESIDNCYHKNVFNNLSNRIKRQGITQAQGRKGEQMALPFNGERLVKKIWGRENSSSIFEINAIKVIYGM